MSFARATANVFELKTATNSDLIIVHKPDERQFVIRFDKKYKFDEYGFASLNAKKIIFEKVRAFDFKYKMNRTKLMIKIEIAHKERIHKHEMGCEETFDLPSNISELNFDMIPEAERAKIFNSLVRKVSNMEERVKKITGELKASKASAWEAKRRRDFPDDESVGYYSASSDESDSD